jgi:REP element-mobilizing transposase RayT
MLRLTSSQPIVLCGNWTEPRDSGARGRGISNHVHFLIALPSDMAPAKAVQVLKANSSRWIRQHGIAFAWQEGYGAFSVSRSNKAVVVEYVEHQAEHHRGAFV